MRRLVVALALLLSGCAHVQPVVKYTCMGCTALLASGVCQMVQTPHGQTVAVPDCLPGEVVVVRNWKAVSEKGAVPVLGCKKEK